MPAPKRMRIGQKMLAALCYIKHHPGCAKVDVALAIHPGSSRANLGSYAAGYPTIDRCIAHGWVAASLDIRARNPVYCLTLTPEGFGLLHSLKGPELCP
jgi:hypothetical protein